MKITTNKEFIITLSVEEAMKITTNKEFIITLTVEEAVLLKTCLGNTSPNERTQWFKNKKMSDLLGEMYFCLADAMRGANDQ